MKIKKRLVKKWGRIKVLETSAVGLPVYPAAHRSYSLVKALRESEEPALVGDKLNIEEDSMEGEEPAKPEGEKPEGEAEDSNSGSSEEKTETTETTETEKTEPEAPAEGAAPTEQKSVKSLVISKKLEGQLAALINQKVENQMTVLMEKAFNQALKESQVPRGLVEDKVEIQKAVQDKLKEMTPGELAIASGLFKETPETVFTKLGRK